MYEYDDDEEGGRSTGRLLAVFAGVVILALVGWFFVKPNLEGDDAGGDSVAPAAADSAGAVDGSAGSGSPATTTTADEGATGATDATDGSADVVADDDAPTTTAGSTRVDPTTATPTTAAATTTAPTAPAASPTPAAPAGPTYNTLPDGTPEPILAIYDTDHVTLSGNVPDQAGKDLLGTLAMATAKPEQQNLVNELTIDPTVPRSIGVRVVELTSARFPEGSAEVTLEQAAEINRLAAILNQLPNLTALVIGHADQRGQEATNYVVSEQRADAVVNYLVSQGIAPSRLSSRAVGESDLLTLDNEPAALALNRRTEFVLYGLLAG
ncbi:MAG: OmpA family protein [Ilumatobacteraceae bacterium]